MKRGEVWTLAGGPGYARRRRVGLGLADHASALVGGVDLGLGQFNHDIRSIA